MSKDLESKGAEALKQIDPADVEAAEESDALELPQDMSVEDAVAKAKRLQAEEARIAQILSRGITNDRLAQIAEAIPAHKHGVMVRERPEDIHRYEALGYQVETEINVKGMHGVGDKRVRVGDVILMTTSQEQRKLIEKVRDDQKRRRKSLGKQEYLERAAHHGVPVIGKN